MNDHITIKRKIISVILGWLIFVGLDFLFHASLFTGQWQEDIAAIKSLTDLAVLIPAGYLSFLLLTALVGYVFFKLFKTKPELKNALLFGFTFALLYALSNFFGLFSYINLPLKHLTIINAVYFIELFTVVYCLYLIGFSKSMKRSILYSILTFFLLIVLGIVIQNIGSFRSS